MEHPVVKMVAHEGKQFYFGGTPISSYGIGNSHSSVSISTWFKRNVSLAARDGTLICPAQEEALNEGGRN